MNLPLHGVLGTPCGGKFTVFYAFVLHLFGHCAEVNSQCFSSGHCEMVNSQCPTLRNDILAFNLVCAVLYCAKIFSLTLTSEEHFLLT